MQTRSARSRLAAFAIPLVACAVFLGLGLLYAAGLVEPPALDPATGHPAVPLASSWGLLALLLLIIGGGFYMARRSPES